MRGRRSRVASSGRLRRKRTDTLVATIESRYGKNIGKDNLQLGTLLKLKRKVSLKKMTK